MREIKKDRKAHSQVNAIGVVKRDTAPMRARMGQHLSRNDDGDDKHSLPFMLEHLHQTSPDQIFKRRFRG